MLFPTLRFTLFFLLVFFLYWYVFRKKKQRALLLVCASYLFYACWDWRFCLLLFSISSFSALLGALLGKQKNYIPRTITIAAGTVVHILFLGFFKYFYDITAFLQYAVFRSPFQSPLFTAVQEYSLLLPVGISYYTFRSMSYIFDIYLCKMRPAQSFIDILLYISFFPQLASGSIVQAQPFFSALPENLEQAYLPTAKPIAFDRSVLLILSGIYKKMILADFLSTLAVNPVFANPAQCNTVELLVGLLSYTFVIYCDFSGYSDMAIGIALLLGFQTPQNFNRPYISQSVSEFWRRWHISFSSWLRDYVYFSFGGSRFGLLRTVSALIGTMIIAGIWHGSALPFLLWGALQGTACAFERIVTVMRKDSRPAVQILPDTADDVSHNANGQFISINPAVRYGKVQHKSFLYRYLRIIGVFLFINISWLIFRSPSLHELRLYIYSLKNITLPFRTVPLFTVVPLTAAFFLQIPGEEFRRKMFYRYVQLPFIAKAAAVTVFFIALNIVSTSGIAPFIYFDF